MQDLVPPDVLCGFCHRGKEVEDVCDKLWHNIDGLGHVCTAHKRCMQYSSNLCQWKFEQFGGFYIHEVEKEIQRAKKLSCSLCADSGASAGCALKSCSKTFHYFCAFNDANVETICIKNEENLIQFCIFCRVHRDEFLRRNSHFCMPGMIGNRQNSRRIVDENDQNMDERHHCNGGECSVTRCSEYERDSLTNGSTNRDMSSHGRCGEPASHEKSSTTLCNGDFEPQDVNNAVDGSRSCAELKRSTDCMDINSSLPSDSVTVPDSSSHFAVNNQDDPIDNENNPAVYGATHVLCMPIVDEQDMDLFQTMLSFAVERFAKYNVISDNVFLWGRSISKGEEKDNYLEQTLSAVLAISKALRYKNLDELESVLFHSTCVPRVTNLPMKDTLTQIKENFTAASQVYDSAQVGRLEWIDTLNVYTAFIFISDLNDRSQRLRARLPKQTQIYRCPRDLIFCEGSDDVAQSTCRRRSEALNMSAWILRAFEFGSVLIYPKESCLRDRDSIKYILSVTEEIKTKVLKDTVAEGDVHLVFIRRTSSDVIVSYRKYVLKVLVYLSEELLTARHDVCVVFDVGRWDTLVSRSTNYKNVASQVSIAQIPDDGISGSLIQTRTFTNAGSSCGRIAARKRSADVLEENNIAFDGIYKMRDILIEHFEAINVEVYCGANPAESPISCVAFHMSL